MKIHSVAHVLLAFFLAIISLCTFADNEPIPHLLEDEHELSMAFETPHTKWAKPYAQGTTRVLFFSPWNQGSTEGREVIELMQRFQLDAEIIYYLRGTKNILGNGNPRPYLSMDAGTQRALKLLEKPFDVFFFTNMTMDMLPDEVQTAMQDQLDAGTGIVLVGDDAKLPFSNAQDFAPAIKAPAHGSYFTHGNSRGALLPTRTPLDYKHGWETQFDYQMAQQGLALLWAANKAPKINLDIQIPTKLIQRGELDKHSFTIAWDNTVLGAELIVEIRRWDGEKVSLDSVRLSRAENATFEFPFLSEGQYHVDAFVKTTRSKICFASAPFEVKTSTRVTQVHLDKSWAEKGETINGTVDCEGLKPEQVILIKLADVHNRVVKMIETEPLAMTTFAFQIEDWMPMLLRVEATLFDNNNLDISSAYSYLNVTTRNQNRFNFVVWNYPGGDLAPYGLKSFVKHGATAVLQGGNPPLSLAANNLSYVPYASSYRASSHTTTAMLKEDGVLKTGCAHDPDNMKKWIERTLETYQDSREHGVFTYSLGDENAVRSSCFDPHCMPAYQAYLKKIYGTIEALNTEWESNYTSFDAIELLEDDPLPRDDAPEWFKQYYAQLRTLNLTDSQGGGEEQARMGDINDEIRALQNENFARWYDRQAFQCYTYVEWCKKFQAAFRTIDPKSLTGFEGTDSFSIRRLTTRSRQGGDLDAFVRELEYFGPYRGPGNEVVRSIAPKNYPMGNWIGYSMDKEVLLEHYWEQVTNCMNMIQWWRWDNFSGYNGFLMPTFSPIKGVQDFIDDTQVVRDGLGDLLMASEMQDDQIAMLYSMPSTYIAHFDGNRSYGDYTRDHKLWYKALHDSGVQFRYVTDRMLRLGEFDTKRFKVLILPLSFAMSPQEAQVIRTFVENGGTVIADVRPATYDGHCKPQETGLLDDLFGIKRNGKLHALPFDRMRIQGTIGEEDVFMEWGDLYGKPVWPKMMVDPNVETTTGTALSQAYPIHYWSGLKHPVAIVNEVGKGRAVLLNFSVNNAPFQGLLKSILASADVRPQITIQTPEGESIKGLEITRWKNEDIDLISLFGKYEGNVVVTLPENKYIYDLNQRLNYGQANKFRTTVRPNRAAFFALLPEASPEFEIETVGQTISVGQTSEISIRIPSSAGKHAMRITATAPNGRIVPWFNRLILADSTPTVVKFPLAFNDQLGIWNVNVTDLYTNITFSEPVWSIR